MSIPAVETERLVLRAHRAEGADAFAAMSADDEVMRWVGGTNAPDRSAARRRWEMLSRRA